MDKIEVGVLGSSGAIGQYYVSLLENHPFFSLKFLSSTRGPFKSYCEALGKHSLFSFTQHTLDLPVLSMEEVETKEGELRLLFSALKSDFAERWERRYASRGIGIISHASFHRWEEDIPLIIPEINPGHLDLLPFQQKKRGWGKGFIVTKPNCSLQSFLLPLYPLHLAFGLDKVHVTTMQAISGGGSFFTLGPTILPYILGEEEKMEREPKKILGKIEKGRLVCNEEVKISSHANRVPVKEGHLATVSVSFKQKGSVNEIFRLWKEAAFLPQILKLPSAPHPLIHYKEEEDRPQPELDARIEKGMGVVVGRLRGCSILDFRFTALSHNLIRGGAGGGVLTAELLYQRGFLS